MAAPTIPANKPLPSGPSSTSRPSSLASSTTPQSQIKRIGEPSSSYQRFEEGLSEAMVREEEEGMDVSVFLVLLAVSIILDLLDLLDLSGVGAAIVVAISFALGAVLYIMLYLFDKGDYNLARQAIAWLVELIPAIGMLPINTLAVVFAFILSQPTTKEKIRQATGVIEATETGRKLIGAARQYQEGAKIIRAGK